MNTVYNRSTLWVALSYTYKSMLLRRRELDMAESARHECHMSGKANKAQHTVTSRPACTNLAVARLTSFALTACAMTK